MSDLLATDKVIKLTKRQFLSTEIGRGKLTSYVALFIGNVMNYVLHTHYGIDIFRSTFFSLFVVANFMSYTLDMLFAKDKICLPRYKGQSNFCGKVPISDFDSRIEFTLRSFGSQQFIKFIILSIIDVIINLSILKFLIKLSDANGILNHWKHRKVIFAFITSSLTFGLFINQLRFQWAYEKQSNFVFDMLMYIWFTLILLIVVGIEDNIIEISEGRETTGNILGV